MRVRALLLVPALVTAVLAIGASGASAATLFTNAGHATRVTVGATASATSTTPLLLTSGATRMNTCTHSSLQLVISQNNDTAVVGTVVGGTFNPCGATMTGAFFMPWRLTMTGAGVMSGGFTRWSAAINNVSFTVFGGLYTGNVTTGITATQPTTPSTIGASPICVHMTAAGSVSGPLTGDGRLDGSFCLSGTSAAFSLT